MDVKEEETACSTPALGGCTRTEGCCSPLGDARSSVWDTVCVPIAAPLPRRAGAPTDPPSPSSTSAQSRKAGLLQEAESNLSRLASCIYLSTAVSMRIILVLLALFLLPTIADIVCKRSLEGGPLTFDPSFRFQTNVHGERIYMDGVASQRMIQHPERRAKAAIVVLARNQDVEAVMLSLTRLEQRFNRKFNYPYVFLNDADFDETFKNRTSGGTRAQTLYGKIPPEHWSYPEWVSPEAAAAARRTMQAKGVLYGGRESYHHMCRYFSGFFYKHPLLADFDYYWRMEPDVHYYCDLDYDPFLFMQENRLKYGFVISILELPNTIPSLWDATRRFAAKNPALVPRDNLLPFVTAADGSYNLCHFWSNFEIGDLNFFRSTAYEEYFKHLDREGGFYMERWGDAPVHSLGVAMLLNSSEVHFFQDIGYRHNSMKHCPATQRNNCDCDAIEAVRFHTPSYGVCHKRWDDFLNGKQGAP